MSQLRDYYRSFAAAILGGVAAFAISTLFTGSVATQFWTALLILTVAVVGACALDYRRTGDAMNILALTGLFYLLAFVAGSAFVWTHASFGVAIPAHYPFSKASLMRAEWLCVLSWVGIVAGYWLRPFRLGIPPLRLQVKSADATKLGLTILFGIGWIARVLGIARGLYFHPTVASSVAVSSTTNQILVVLGILPAICVAYVGVRAYAERRLRWYYRAGILIEFAFSIPTGARLNAVTVLVLLLAVKYYAEHRFPLKATLLAIVVAMFFVFPVLFLYRAGSSQQGFTSLSTGVQTYTAGGAGNALLFGLGETFFRFADIQLPAALEERGRQAYPLPTGQTILWAFATLIPHAVYPDKPSLLKFMDDLAYQLRVTPVHNSSFAITNVGEMYLDFGTVGLLVAMIVLGAIYRELNEWLSLRRESPMVLAIYAAVGLTIMTNQESPVGTGLFGLIRELVVLAIVLRCAAWLFEGRPGLSLPAT